MPILSQETLNNIKHDEYSRGRQDGRDEMRRELYTPKHVDVYAKAEIDAIRDQNDSVIDFLHPNISVFSIERVNVGTLEEKTVVGYFVKLNEGLVEDANDNQKSSVVREWSLLLSRTQHANLIAAWIESKDTNENRP